MYSIAPHAIWFWRHGNLKSSISLVNDQYRFDIYDPATGHLIHRGEDVTLAKSKRLVFDYFGVE